jgi:aspartate 1-decarboxylase
MSGAFLCKWGNLEIFIRSQEGWRTMLYTMFHGKIHRAIVTEANLNYMGSITIDQDLMDAAGILPGERVQIVNNNNGERLETYTIAGKRGSGMICLNGAAARKAQIGDMVIIIAYAQMDEKEARSFVPKVVMVDEHNHIISDIGREEAGQTVKKAVKKAEKRKKK